MMKRNLFLILIPVIVLVSVGIYIFMNSQFLLSKRNVASAKDVNNYEILLVSGALYRNDSLEWAPFYRLPSGTIRDASPGSYSILVLDWDGKILYNIPFNIKFLIMTHPPQETNAAPFGFVVPYYQKASIVQVRNNGKILAQVHIITKLLYDAVESIPDSGFIDNPSQYRKALQDKINALDLQLSKGNIADARNNLRNDIHKHFVEWLVDEYTTKSPLEYTKPAILELVDNSLQRLEGLD